MSYGTTTDIDKKLDKTVAWVTTCIVIVALSVIAGFTSDVLYNQKIRHDLVIAGFCEVQNNPGLPLYGTRWERCK